ncbi:serine/threonine-protein kinase [Nocardia rhamnosiphila]|uniref:serine/threonine-protein kinase n=1 Tax=Nocardia rhamnosiphila TaxID=426716 RepID=UPI0009DCC095|nr:serine/threonine-protein kinase [Nocardia rhamnosiphila]
MLARGTVFAGYRIEHMLGSGGMGAVYLARHPRLPRWVALKILYNTAFGGVEFTKRFEREAELVARLDHRNIVAIYDRGFELDNPWLSMQYVDGQDLAKVIAQERPSVARAVYILGEAARGLDYAHRAGLLHRDVKPANILVAPAHDNEDDEERVLVTDFGIARALDDSASLTASGSVLATLAYAAPEQLQGGDIDHRVDVYALGATFFEMLTGAPPYPRSTPLAVMHAHLSEPTPKPSTINPRLWAFDDVIAKAMAKDPADRFQTCRALADATTHALEGGALPRTPLVTGMTGGIPVENRNAVTTVAAHFHRDSPVAAQPHGAHTTISNRLFWIGSTAIIGVVALLAGIAYFGDHSAHPSTAAISPHSTTAMTTAPVPRSTDITGLCGRVPSATLPAKVRNLTLDTERSTSAYQTCTWITPGTKSFTATALWDLEIEVHATNTAQTMFLDRERSIENNRKLTATPLPGVGDEAVSGVIPDWKYIAEPSADNRNRFYHGRGAVVLVRVRDAVIEVRWVGADYESDAHSGGALEVWGVSLPDEQAHSEAVAVAQEVVRQLPG